MKKLRQWWKTECVRAAYKSGGMLLKAVISVVIAGMIAFCAYTLWFRGESTPLARIGYTAQDGRLTALALAFVENMESVSSFCELVPVTEEEGRQQLMAGELSAWLVLPDDVVDGILSGNNQSAILYRREENTSSADAAFGRIFETLANAGVGMLKTAQAEIYATGLITERFSYGREFLEEFYQEIDLYNLRIVLSREQLFRYRSLSATGNEGIAVYYAGALLTLYLLLLPCFFGGYAKRNKKEIKLLAIRGGIPGAMQLIGRGLISMALLLLMLLPAALLWTYAGVRDALQPIFSGSVWALLVLSLACTAALAQLIYLSVEKGRTAILWLGILAFTQGYASGCLIPSALLPRSIAGLGAFLPAAGIKAAFTGLFSSTPGNAMSAAFLLSTWTILFMVACLWQQRREERMPLKPVSNRKNTFLGTGLIGILTKRLLWQKSILCCLVVTVLGAGVAMRLESTSKAALYAAVYDEAGTWQSLLEEQEGLVQFLLCESEDEVKRYVMQGKAECGYVLQEDLQSKIEAGGAAFSITVYESADAMLTKMVNEVLFERLFYGISSEWYEGYIAGDERLAEAFAQSTREETENAIKQAFSEKYTDESTFAVETRILGEDAPAAFVLSYPVGVIAGLCLLLCAIIGVGQACTDTRLGRFRNKPYAAAFITILLPTAGALLSGILSLAICGQIGKSYILTGATLPIVGVGMLGWIIYRRAVLTNNVC